MLIESNYKNKNNNKDNVEKNTEYGKKEIHRSKNKKKKDAGKYNGQSIYAEFEMTKVSGIF